MHYQMNRQMSQQLRLYAKAVMSVVVQLHGSNTWQKHSYTDSLRIQMGDVHCPGKRITNGSKV